MRLHFFTIYDLAHPHLISKSKNQAPLTRSTHGPSTGISPSSVMLSAVKKAIAAARSSTTTLTWSNLLIVMSLGVASAQRGDDLLLRVGSFVRAASDQLDGVIADETYRQELYAQPSFESTRPRIRQRSMRSEALFLFH